MVVRYYRSRGSAAVFSAFYVLLSFQCMVTSHSTKARLREESSVSKKPIYVIANSENTSQQPQLYTRHRRKLPPESNDQLNALDDDVPLQEYQGVFGRPGIDFPVLSSIPVTKFNCRHVKNSNTGYYADTETNCQVFHVCDAGRKISFLCPNGTIFRQSHLICDWWFRVDCERSPELYDQSVQQLEADQNVHNNKQRVETIASAMQNAVNRNSNELPMVLPSPSPSPVTNNIKENFNSESELPNRNGGNSQRNTLRPNYQLNPEPANRNNFNAITSPPRLSSFNAAINPTFATSEMPYISTRLQTSENPRPNSVSTDSYTFVSSTYKPNVTPLIHNFLPPNDPGEGFREQQVLAETASFAGSGKYPFQNYYYMMNYVKHPSKENTNKASEFTTSNQGIETTQYQTESYTDTDELFRTTFYPGNNDFRDSNIVNVNNPTEGDNSSYALYYTSTNEAANSFGTTLPNDFRGISPSLSNNASNPQVSEFILNSQSDSEMNGETPTEENLPLLTNMTQEAFNQLFPKDEKVAEQSNSTNTFRTSDLATEHSSGIVQSDGQKSQKQEVLSNALQFNSSPDLRELAQVFSRALSAYLENPEQFRKILSEVRPTEPPSTNENSNGEASSVDDEVLAFSEDVGMKSTTVTGKSPIAKNTKSGFVDQITFTTSSPIKSTIKNPETFAEEINNFMFNDPHNFLGHSESNEFNVNETYYPSSQQPSSNATTLAASRAQFTVSPLYDFSRNVTRFSSPVTFTEAAPTFTTAFKGIPKNDNLYSDLKPQSNSDIGQSLSEKEHFITADTQSFVSRDNLLRYQNNFKPVQNFKSNDAAQNFKPSPVNQVPSVPQSKFDSDYQAIKSSKNMQFGMRTTSVTRSPLISSRADFSSQTTPSSALTTKVFSTSRATTYHPEAGTTRFSTYHTTNSNYQTSATNAAFDNRDPKSYNTEMYKDLSPDSGHFNETARALINMMEEAKSNNVLRHQLVLLLVNDKGLPTENKSVKEMKSKLLKALLKPAPDKNVPRNYRSNSDRVSRSDNSTLVNASSSKARKERVVVHKHKVASPSQTTDSISKSTVSSFRSRNERSTSKPVVVAALTESTQSPELSESDSRAVDLLKSLYTIASNNWVN